MTDGETIFALASGRGRAGVAVIRISGPDAGAALQALTGCSLPPPRRAVLRAVSDPKSGVLLDRGLVLWMPAPHSFTGEDSGEIHVHGGPAIIAGVLDALGRVSGCRMAEAGEFTRRALFNDKMDLTQVEGLADLIAAETEAQRRQALRQSEGGLGALYDGWRDRLLRAIAYVEAAIDFAEEELPEDLAESMRPEIAALAEEIRRHLDDNRRGERLRDGVSVAILGAPNAGKSSLLNLLARRDAAIVSEIAGTTRDVVEVHLDLGGYPVILLDTAGIRAEAEAVEAEGIRRALEHAEKADIKLVLSDAVEWPEMPAATRTLLDERSILVLSKADLCAGEGEGLPEDAIPLSVKSGAGVDRLLHDLGARVKEEFEAGAGEGLVPTRARHRAALEDALAALTRYLEGQDLTPDLAAEDLRVAIAALGRITGRVDVEDYLDVIFRDFCIGK